jgi:hypothetical protein
LFTVRSFIAVAESNQRTTPLSVTESEVFNFVRMEGRS